MNRPLEEGGNCRGNGLGVWIVAVESIPEIPGGVAGSFNCADVRDLAAGVISCCGKGRKGEGYIMGNRTVTMQDLFVFEKRGLSPEGRVLGRFAATGIRPRFHEKLLSAGILLRADLFDESEEI